MPGTLNIFAFPDEPQAVFAVRRGLCGSCEWTYRCSHANTSHASASNVTCVCDISVMRRARLLHCLEAKRSQPCTVVHDTAEEDQVLYRGEDDGTRCVVHMRKYRR